MALNWASKDYFSMLLTQDKRAHAALEMLVDDLHTDKERTISRFLCHSGSEDFLWGLVGLLGNNNARVAGNSAYILGTLAESEMGCYRVISLTAASNPESKKIMPDLTNMLTFDDSESVMNAAGTMGTLAESHEGRLWMLNECCLPVTLTHITALLDSTNMWTASNAALVLARLTISEDGCEKLLGHASSQNILSKLISSLGVDEAGRGMNAAFAIGRLCDMEQGRSRLLGISDSERMISHLAKMLCCEDPGASKNACFALSCLATNKEGHQRLLKNAHSDEVLQMLAGLLSAEDGETGWFAAMTLRTLASQPKGCLRLRDHQSVMPALKSVQEEEEVNPDLREEILQTLEILKRLEKPPPPTVNGLGATSVEVYWSEMTTKSGFDVRYHLFEDGRCAYSGKDLSFTVTNLLPSTNYTFRVRASTDGDESPMSESVSITTEEAIPGIPQNLRIVAVTTTQIRIAWDIPEGHYGNLKGYYVYNEGTQVEFTQELSSIISGLLPSTSYEIQVCAMTSKGKGPKDTVCGSTSELGAHAPAKPDVIVRGRNEIHITWKPPEVPLGRISRYDLSMNGEVIYSGNELHYTACRLRPDTEYSFTVSALTSEGKCESKSTKRRTAKDEYEGERAPLYQSPPKKEVDTQSEPSRAISAKSATKRRKSSVGVATNFAKTSKDDQERAASLKMSTGIPISKREQYEMTVAGGWFPDANHIPKPPKNVSQEKSEMPQEQPESVKKGVKDVSVDKPGKGGASRPHNTLERSKTTLSGKSRGQKSLSGTPSASVATVGSIILEGSHRTEANRLPKPKRPDLFKPQVPNSIPVRLVKSVHSTASVGAFENSVPKASVPSKSPRRISSSTESVALDISMPSSLNRTSKVSDIADIANRDRKPSIVSDSALSQSEYRSDELGVDSLRSYGSNPSLVSQDENNKESDVWHARTARRRSTKSLETPALCRTMTTLSSIPYKPVHATKVKPPGYVDFDAALPLPQRAPNEPPAYVQRANTFIANQSSRSSIRRSLEKMSGSASSSRHSASSSSSAIGPHSWAVNLPPSQHKENSHNKFVPMQYRTQPANLPGPTRFSRQTTSLGFLNPGVPSLNVHGMSRSSTNLEFHKPVNLDGSPDTGNVDTSTTVQEVSSGFPAGLPRQPKPHHRSSALPVESVGSEDCENHTQITSKSDIVPGVNQRNSKPVPTRTVMSNFSISQLAAKTPQSAR